jgi:AAA-like domain
VKPPARAVVGQVIWSRDGGVWAVWRVDPFAHAHTSTGDKLAVHARLRGMLIGAPADSMLLSVCEQLDRWDVVADMLEGVDEATHPAWSAVCEASAGELAGRPLHRRRYYLAACLPNGSRSWRDLLRGAAGDVSASFGLPPGRVPASEIDLRARQARAIEARLERHVTLSRAGTGEIRWLYARALRREINEPALDDSWEPVDRGPGRGSAGVVAHLTGATVKEGGYSGDPDRPRYRRYVRVDTPDGTGYQTVLALAELPHQFTFPGGGGEWLYHADELDFPVDWCVRVRSVPNAEAQSKVRRKHRDLLGQVEEYDGEVTGAPPQLADAIGAISSERAALAANPTEPELQATILLAIAAPDLATLEERAGAIRAMFEPEEYGVARPTGGQTGLLRSMLPGTSPAPVCRDYVQFLLAGDLAAGAPLCGPDVGDPHGLLLGVSLDTGSPAPVLFDPEYGPRVNKSPSLAAVGRLGSGKSFMLKRLCWDTLARGGQVVTIDRTRVGEYARFAETAPGRVQVVRLDADAAVCVDPLVMFAGDDRVTVTLGFLSLLAGCSTQGEEGAALNEAVETVAARPGGRLGDVVDELDRMGHGTPDPDVVARSLARRLATYRTRGAGRLAFGAGRPVSLDADLIVFWAPNLSLPDRETLEAEHRARNMLPEEVLGQALLYLVAAVGRRVVFEDPHRFGAALYDEAWALLASPFGRKLLIEGVRDGRKHNGAIWLASQLATDFEISDLLDLLGARFVFDQALGAIPSALRFLGVRHSDDAAARLEAGLREGQCLYRDVRDRVGLLHVLPPALAELHDAFNTTPGTQPALATPPARHHRRRPQLVSPPAAAVPEAVSARAISELRASSPPQLVSAAVASDALPPRASSALRAVGDAQPGVSGTRSPASADGQWSPAAEARARARLRRRSPLAQALAEGIDR